MQQDEAHRRFAAFVLPQADHAFRLALWLPRSRHDAEDIVQDAALRAFRAIDSCDGTRARAWFLTIVRHTAFTWLAKNRPQDLVATDDLEAAERAHPDLDPAFGAEPPANPEQALLERQQNNRLTAAVAALPVDFRAVILLRETENLGYREIAAILDIPLGTVMSRLARARASLAKALAEDRA